MKKYLPIIIIVGLLCGNIAISETQKQEKIQQSLELNDEFIQHYEFMLNEEERDKKEKIIIRDGYKGFLIWTSHEFYEYDPERKHFIKEL